MLPLWPAALVVMLTSTGATPAQADTPQIPTEPGVTFVLAVDNSASPRPAAGVQNVLQGDYEVIVAISQVNAGGIELTASMDGYDEAGVPRQGTIRRLVRTNELTHAHLQIFGFHTDDPLVIDGATSLGPSLDMMSALRQSGSTSYAFRNFASQPTISGTLTRSDRSPIEFPVLINGKRVVLDAVHATGQMALGNATRPFETYLLDHPKHPLSLRVAYGPREGSFPFVPDFAREIVRIEFPAQDVSLARSLEEDCREEVPGIYFDFNQATLKPQSKRALQEIATVLSAPPLRHVRIEGHTDSIGSEVYNDDLSARRAAAVKTALVNDFAADSNRLSTAGRGERQPVESNDTLAGRARNRRVELVCAD